MKIFFISLFLRTGQISKGDKKRKLSLLVIILRGVIALSLIATLVNIFVNGYQYNSLFEFFPGLVLGIFLLLLALAKKGFLVFPAVVLVSFLSLLAYYLAYQWGTGVPQSWTILVLSIVIAGVIITARFALMLLVVHAGIFLLLTYLQVNGKLVYKWWDIAPTYGSVIIMLVILSVLGLISWLSNREIEKALYRARESEKQLRQQRDSLAMLVAEKTKELQDSWDKERANLQEFASIGRHTIGLLHEVVNPLTTISLNLKLLKDQQRSHLLSRAVLASKQMKQYVEETQKQLQNKNKRAFFSPVVAAKKAKRGLAQRARKARVSITIQPSPLKLYGNPALFNHVFSNLLINAIDSLNETENTQKHQIKVTIQNSKQSAVLKVIDNGAGIATQNLSRIFEPFFTTKSGRGQMGMGLAICKEIVEKDFRGRMNVKSTIGVGTTFTIKVPIKNSDSLLK